MNYPFKHSTSDVCAHLVGVASLSPDEVIAAPCCSLLVLQLSDHPKYYTDRKKASVLYKLFFVLHEGLWKSLCVYLKCNESANFISAQLFPFFVVSFLLISWVSFICDVIKILHSLHAIGWFLPLFIWTHRSVKSLTGTFKKKWLKLICRYQTKQFFSFVLLITHSKMVSHAATVLVKWLIRISEHRNLLIYNE